MKVTREFSPVTIVLESNEDVQQLMLMLRHCCAYEVLGGGKVEAQSALYRKACEFIQQLQKVQQ